MEPMTNIKLTNIGLIDNMHDSGRVSVSYTHSLMILLTEEGI